MKPRLRRSSWRAFASTHPLMLPSTCSREALLACPLFLPWNLPSFTMESTLSTPCSRSDPPLSRQGAALTHLDSLLPLMIWYYEQTALFFFLLARAALASAMRKKGLPEVIARTLIGLYHGAKTKVRVESEEFVVQVGAHQ